MTLGEKMQEIIQESVMRHERPTKNKFHPTMKPITLIARMLKNSTNPDLDKAPIVLDLFGVSGSTLMACEQMGRKAYLSEMDPKYRA